MTKTQLNSMKKMVSLRMPKKLCIFKYHQILYDFRWIKIDFGVYNWFWCLVVVKWIWFPG